VATKRKPAPEVEQLRVRRGRPESKPLPPHIEAFARGDDDALWMRERRGARLNDPRPVALIPGVKNSDARVVFDARLRRMHEAQHQNDETLLAEELAEAHVLGLWRANNIVSFDVMVEVALGLEARAARALVTEGRAALGLPDRISEAELAVWMRAEAGVLEAAEAGRVRLFAGNLVVSVPLEWAAGALAAAGRREAPLAEVAMGPHSVMDRPRGVPSMKEVIERERRIKDED